MMSPPSLIRRLAAIIYDTLLLISVLFVATALILPFNAGQAISPSQMGFYWFYLLTISFIFYGWFWTHGGQTLGLRAWNMQVLTIEGKSISWCHAFLRFSVAILSWSALGLGFIWSMIDSDKRCWHDQLSKTALFYQPKK
ncbi:MAG: hypothetical protein QG557_1004 [Pseudomonadota bacterium]|jgi:uncharacterized RDD family membrane protein YckC|nr:hypothetical protein [Pseudomonadota bacterium]